MGEPLPVGFETFGGRYVMRSEVVVSVAKSSTTLRLWTPESSLPILLPRPCSSSRLLALRVKRVGPPRLARCRRSDLHGPLQIELDLELAFVAAVPRASDDDRTTVALLDAKPLRLLPERDSILA